MGLATLKLWSFEHARMNSNGRLLAACTALVRIWPEAEVSGIAAISSDYRGTFTVPPWRAGRVFMSFRCWGGLPGAMHHWAERYSLRGAIFADAHFPPTR